MCESVTRATSSTIIRIENDISDNHMRHRNFVQNHNDPFSVNELNWRKKLSSSNYQHHHIDKNPASLLLLFLLVLRTTAHACHTANCHRRTTSTNWINIRWVKAIRANRRSQPFYTTKYSDIEHNLTNLDVHFEWNSRIYFSISPKIYSR